MQLIRIRKFLLDYLIGSGLIIVLFLILIGNFTIMDTKANLVLLEKCSSLDSSQDILDSAKLVLRNDEICELVQPCIDLQVIRCAGTATVAEIPLHIFAEDLLVRRVQRQLVDQFGISGYSDKSTFRIPTSLAIFIFLYLGVLVEAGALLFALWRQNLLRESFVFPSNSKPDQLFKPLLIGAFLATAILGLNFYVNGIFEYPDEDKAQAYLAYFQSATGAFLAILVAPLAEELIFRGVLLRFFLERKRQLLGWILVSVLFASLHVMSEESTGWLFYKFLIYFLFSAVLCWTYIRQKTLWSPIMLHAGYNATMVGFLHVFG